MKGTRRQGSSFGQSLPRNPIQRFVCLHCKPPLVLQARKKPASCPICKKVTTQEMYLAHVENMRAAAIAAARPKPLEGMA